MSFDTKARLSGSKRSVSVPVANLHEGASSVSRGDTALLEVRGVRTVKSVVTEVGPEGVLVEVFDKDVPIFAGAPSCRVQFRRSTAVYDKLHWGVGQVIEGNHTELLFASRGARPTATVTLENPAHLNTEQVAFCEALLTASASPSPPAAPLILFGPPGTGKSEALAFAVNAVLQKHPGARILMATPTNDSADNLVLRLLKTRAPAEIARVLGHMREADHCPADVRAMCHGVEGSTRVVCCTNVSALRLVQDRALFPVTHVIMDEAGYATEPEALLPIVSAMKLCGDREPVIVLAGDPKQLGPVIRSNEPGSVLAESMLVRLIRSVDAVQLRVSYRCAPDVLALPSAWFYEDGLESARPYSPLGHALSHWTGAGNPDGADRSVRVVDVHGTEQREEGSPSYFNTAEASETIAICRKLLAEVPGLQLGDIGIISPYSKQVRKLRRATKLAFPASTTEDFIDVGSTEQWAGREREVIILSLTRTQSLALLADGRERNIGFVSNPGRVCVATTRARSLFIILGDPAVMESDVHWSDYRKRFPVHSARSGVSTLDALVPSMSSLSI